MKIKIILEEEDHDYLVRCLENYLETLNASDKIRAVAKLLEQIEFEYKEVDPKKEEVRGKYR